MPIIINHGYLMAYNLIWTLLSEMDWEKHLFATIQCCLTSTLLKRLERKYFNCTVLSIKWKWNYKNQLIKRVNSQNPHTIILTCVLFLVASVKVILFRFDISETSTVSWLQIWLNLSSKNVYKVVVIF